MSSPFPSSQVALADNKRGFALIITIVLVAFLVLLIVSLATFTRVETVVSDNADSKLAARQNALAALNIALGELQRAAGADQRVTAPAESTPSTAVLSAPLPTAPGAAYNAATWNTFSDNLDTFWDGRSRNWVGVWRNGAAFPATSPRLVNWLVSGNERESVITGGAHATPTFRPDMAVSGLTNFSLAALLNPTINGVPSAVLVGNYSASGQADPSSPVIADRSRYVVAPKVNITGVLPDGSNGVIGRYAWWVGDQGTKATIDAAYFNINDIGDADNNGTTDLTADVQQILKLQQPTRVGFEESLNNFVSSTQWNKVLSYNQMIFGPNNIDARDVRSRFHDFGLVSSGLLVNLRDGGFRVDLTANPAAAPAGSGLSNYIAAANSPGEILLGDLLVGNSGGNTSVNAQSHPDRDGRLGGLIRSHPLTGIRMDTFEPVVAGVRISYKLEYNAGFVLTPRPELLIWNPYNADFEWIQTDGGTVYRNGYRYRVRLSYDRDDNGGASWDGQVSISCYWQDTDGVLAERTTVDTLPLNLFVDGVDNDSTPDPNRIRADFLSEAHTGLTASSIDGRNWRLRAGDVALMRGNPMRRDVASAQGGTPLAAVALPQANSAATGATPNFYETLNSATVLSYSTAGVSSRTLRVEVFARPIAYDGNDVANTDAGAAFLTNGPSAAQVKEDSLLNETLALEFAVFNPVANNNPGSLIAWEAAWRPSTPPDGFFDPAVALVGLSPGSPPTIIPDQEAYVSVGFRSSVMDANFWTEYMQNDPRTTFRSFVEITSSNPSFPVDVLLGSRFGDLGVGLPASVGPDDQRFPVLFEVPRVQPVSLGELMHTFPNAGGQSPHLLGLSPDAVPGAISNTVRNLNQDTWDTFFFSTLDAPLSLAQVRTFKPTNTRLKIQGIPNKTDADTRNYLNGVAEAAALRLVGAFNINSPSARAWQSVLNNAADQTLAAVGWDTDVGGDDGFVVAGLDVDTSYGRFNQAPGVTWSFRHAELDAMVAGGSEGQASLVRNGHRALAPLDFHGRLVFDGGYPGNPPGGNSAQVTGMNGRTILAEFARILTLDMKRRVIDAGANGGPFLSLSDFVNSGTLQYAIDNVEWTNGAGTTENGLNWVQHTRNNWDDFSAYKNLPSYLSQREMLKALAPVLTARSDTFVIRTYGEVVNPADSSEVVGRAWCEALVQRDVDYVDPSNDPEVTSGLSATNQEFGRRYRIIAFRWLDATDI